MYCEKVSARSVTPPLAARSVSAPLAARSVRALLALVLLLPMTMALLGCTDVSSKPAPAVTPAPTPSVTPTPQTLPLTRLATINQVKLKLAVAATPMQQQIGLMYRTSLLDDEGMLFSFEPARPVAFWMKQTLIPLDMLYIRSGIVREIQANVPPCKADPCPSYPSKTTIDQVIEIRGGLAEKLGIKVGDRVVLTPIEN
jgi:uncharacterized protein